MSARFPGAGDGADPRGLLLALRLSRHGRTAGWPEVAWAWVALGWPMWLSLGAGVALLRRAEFALLTWLLLRVQRRLARLGCKFSVE